MVDGPRGGLAAAVDPVADRGVRLVEPRGDVVRVMHDVHDAGVDQPDVVELVPPEQDGRECRGAEDEAPDLARALLPEDAVSVVRDYLAETTTGFGPFYLHRLVHLARLAVRGRLLGAVDGHEGHGDDDHRYGYQRTDVMEAGICADGCVHSYYQQDVNWTHPVPYAEPPEDSDERASSLPLPWYFPAWAGHDVSVLEKWLAWAINVIPLKRHKYKDHRREYKAGMMSTRLTRRMIVLVYGLISPHPPIIVPEIGGDDTKRVRKTTKALDAAAHDFARTRPEELIIISPHEDHGFEVPLYYLRPYLPEKTGVQEILVTHDSYEYYFEYGKQVGVSLRGSRKRYGIVASGDLSHVLKADGPYGFNSFGPPLDEAIVAAVRGRDANGLLGLDPEMLEQGAECGLRSILFLLGAFDGMKVRVEVPSYEGPFGVGYMVATFEPEESK